MAVIKEYEQQFGVKEFSGGRRAGGEDFGFAQGISDLARGINAGADAMQRYEAQRQLSDAQVKVTEADGVMDESLRGMQESAQPGVSTALQAKAMMTDYFKKMQDNYTSPAAKQYIALHGAKMTNTAVNRMSALDLDLNVKDKFAKQDTILKSVEDKAFANPDSFQESVDALMYEIENGIGVWDVPGGERTRIAMKARVDKKIASIAYAAGLGAIEKSIPFRATMASFVPNKSLNMTVDDVMPFLVKQESSGKHKDASGKLIESPKGALGITQVLPATAADPGFGVKPLQNDSKEEYLRFGKEYLTALHKEFGGDMAKALAAYNSGHVTVKNAVALNGDNWLSAMPNETKNYVSKITGNKGQSQDIEPPKTIEGAPWYESLSVEQKVNLHRQAEQKQRKEQAVADKERDSLISDQDAYFARTLKVPPTVISPASFRDSAERQAYEAKLSAQNIVQGIADEPYSVQIAALEKAKPQIYAGQEPGVYAKQEQVYREAQKIVIEANKKRNENPVGIAYERGFSTDNPITPIQDVTDPAKMVETLKVRAPQARAVNQTYGTGKDWLLMKNESENIQRLFSTMNFQKRADYLETIRDGLSKDDYNAVVGQVWKDNKAIASAGHMLSKPMDVTVKGVNAQAIAETILVGEQAMNRTFTKEGTDEEKAFAKALIPSKADARALAGEILKGVQVSPNDFDAMSEAVLAHYIGSKIKLEGGGANTGLSGADTVAVANRKLFKESVEMVLGTPSNINGKVLRPWGMSDADFKDKANILIQRNYPDMEHASLLATGKEGRYELTVGGMPTQQYIDVLRGDENYGTEGFKRPFVPNEKSPDKKHIGDNKKAIAQKPASTIETTLSPTSLSYGDVTK